MAAKVRVTYRKYNGDDAYSYAIFLDGRLADNNLTGLNLSQARYYRDQVRARIGAK